MTCSSSGQTSTRSREDRNTSIWFPATTGRAEPVRATAGGFAALERDWKDDLVRPELPMALTTSSIPDEPGTVDFLEGPVVMAGLCDGTSVLHGDPDRPETMLALDNEREWGNWRIRYRTRDLKRAIPFIPLYEVVDEQYTVYFPARRAQ